MEEEIIEKEDLRKSIVRRIHKMPLGEDAKLLKEILFELEKRFMGINLFEESVYSISQLTLEEVKQLIANIVGSEDQKDIYKISDKLARYDYEVFFVPRLYKDLIEVENKIRRLRDLVEPALRFSKLDHKKHFETLLDNVFEDKYIEISSLLGLDTEYKTQYNQAKDTFKDILFREVWPKYEDIVHRFIKMIDANKNSAVKDIDKFKQTRIVFECKLREKHYLKMFLNDKTRKVENV